MTTIHFYEKPGCINNTKQKAILQAAGHELSLHNLLQEAWTPETLRPFFGDRPVADWFNRTAPAVKSGVVVPETLDEPTALRLMIADPLLIRRPLLRVGDRHEVGFSLSTIEAWLGLEPQETEALPFQNQDLENCPRHPA